MIFILDTETTSLRPGEICQLSYILAGNGAPIAKNFYFSVHEMDPSAAMIHGLTKEFLASASGGRYFKDFAGEILRDYMACTHVAAHNARFDIGFLQAECERIGRRLPTKAVFDTMRAYTPVCKMPRKHNTGYKFPKLCELTDFLEYSDEDILAETRKLFGADCGFHDARFDTTAVYLALKRAKEYDDINAEDLNDQDLNDIVY